MIENGIKDLRFHEIIAFSYVYFMENYIKTWKEKIENKGMRRRKWALTYSTRE